MLFPLLATNDLATGWALMAVGMAVVFLALCLLLTVITLLNLIFKAAPPSTPSPARPGPAQGISPELLAIFAAAAAVALGKPVAIRSAQLSDPQPPDESAS